MKNYCITDLNGYCEIVRDSVARSFCEEYKENLDNYISLEQVKNLIKKNSSGKNENGQYIINPEIFDNTFDELRQWLYSVSLAKLASSGIIEVAFDQKKNDFTFWLNDTSKTEILPNPADD